MQNVGIFDMEKLLSVAIKCQTEEIFGDSIFPTTFSSGARPLNKF
jgi:hypothetical protein